MRRMSPWLVMIWVKAIEVIVQTRPRALARLLFTRDAKIAHAIRWYYQMGRRVWFHEIFAFVFQEKRVKLAVTLRDFWGTARDGEEEAMGTKLASRPHADKLQETPLVPPPPINAEPALPAAPT